MVVEVKWNMPVNQDGVAKANQLCGAAFEETQAALAEIIGAASVVRVSASKHYGSGASQLSNAISH